MEFFTDAWILSVFTGVEFSCGNFVVALDINEGKQDGFMFYVRATSEQVQIVHQYNTVPSTKRSIIYDIFWGKFVLLKIPPV